MALLTMRSKPFGKENGDEGSRYQQNGDHVPPVKQTLGYSAVSKSHNVHQSHLVQALVLSRLIRQLFCSFSSRMSFSAAERDASFRFPADRTAALESEDACSR